MLQKVLIASDLEPFSTKRPNAIIQALFPQLGAAIDPKTTLLLNQWMRMLDGLSPLEGPVGLRLATESSLTVDQNTSNFNVDLPGKSACLTCFVKVETLRKSNLGCLQVCRVGKIDHRFTVVDLIEPAQYVVIKVFEMQKAAHIQENPINEVVLHHKLLRGKEAGILPMLGCLASAERIYAIFPYVRDGDMFRFLSEAPQRLSEIEIRTIMRGMLQGISRCHANFVCHRDISLENFLKQDDQLTLIDFGLSVEMDQNDYTILNHGPVGKTKYMAPELAAGYPNLVDGRKLDIWSLGVTLFMLITQTEPFHVALNVDERYRTLITKRQMRTVFQSWGVQISAKLMDLLEIMLEQDPAKRPTVEEVFTHSWMMDE